MKLWLISQTVNEGWDTYDSAVVAAKNEKDARNTHPSGSTFLERAELFVGPYPDWCAPNRVKVKYLGITKEPAGVICASFNAG